ncbi:MAG: cytidine 5'-phosphate N-acetylneuraminic acid synthetase [Crocinitomicaceae bacterium]|nr:cytidine 5'-phosphate N-acetylneuraminic acid synthetase [Crocinitomicaceae bacterium]|tara:strand:- start:28330 stop:29940 length:1611 start_codon:yes stop_codon:yes gene_type:complete
MKDYCVIIPAISGNSRIPNYLTKKLNGKPLVQRAIDLAIGIEDISNVFIITNNEDIALLAERSKVNCTVKPISKIPFDKIFEEFQFFFLKRKSEYKHIILLRPDTPMLTAAQIKSACKDFQTRDEDVLITLKEENHSIWKQNSTTGFQEILQEKNTEKIFVESNAFMVLKSAAVGKNNSVYPVILKEEAFEVNTFQNWWIGEKLLARKRVLFVVAGYPAIGLGHVFRVLTIAHEILDHKVTFLCTKESELAVQKITSGEYYSVIQNKDLLSEVLQIKPDLVINDILNTDKDYVQGLKEYGIKVINFEDIGEGAAYTDITVNELYDTPIIDADNILWGKDYLFLRDEFIGARPNEFSEQVDSILISFGGTDPSNYTLEALKLILPVCVDHGIKIYIVTGNGYSHKDALKDYIAQCGYHNIEHTSATGIISSIMENVQIGISSNGRTTYELAHMNIVSMVMSHHERENTHKFASFENGFLHMGIYKENPQPNRFRDSFKQLVEDKDYRLAQFRKMEPLSFVSNKQKVVNIINNLLEEE